MITKNNLLAIIPARGGSKGLPGKNTHPFCGKPLIAWTIEAALASAYIKRLILSSDDEDIMSIAQTYGCEVPFKRSDLLAQDDTSTLDVVFDAITQCAGYEWVILLQPTSPLRETQDIERAIHYCIEKKADACVSVCEVKQSPYWMYTLTDSQTLKPLMLSPRPSRRQELPPCFALNGAIYVARIEKLIQNKTFILPNTVPYVMPEERSADIDTYKDLLLAENIRAATVRERNS